MSNILAIETSFPEASITLAQHSFPPQSLHFESHRQQNKLLFPPLESLIHSLPENEKLDLIIIGTGPGSYSGTRIAIAAAQGIAAIHHCTVIGLSSFLGTDAQLGTHDRIAVGDARRGAYYITEIPKGDLPKSPQLMEEEPFHHYLSQTTSHIFSLEEHMIRQANVPIEHKKPTAQNLIRSWLDLPEDSKQTILHTPPSPTYLRAPFITKAKPGHPLLRGKTSDNSH